LVRKRYERKRLMQVQEYINAWNVSDNERRSMLSSCPCGKAGLWKPRNPGRKNENMKMRRSPRLGNKLRIEDPKMMVRKRYVSGPIPVPIPFSESHRHLSRRTPRRNRPTRTSRRIRKPTRMAIPAHMTIQHHWTEHSRRTFRKLCEISLSRRRHVRQRRP
jgi:hypothetical protein